MKTYPTSTPPNSLGEAEPQASLFLWTIRQIKWRKIMAFFFVLSLIAVGVSMVIEDLNFILYSLIYFGIMLAFLTIDLFIEEYRERKKAKELLGL